MCHQEESFDSYCVGEGVVRRGQRAFCDALLFMFLIPTYTHTSHDTTMYCTGSGTAKLPLFTCLELTVTVLLSSARETTYLKAWI